MQKMLDIRRFSNCTGEKYFKKWISGEFNFAKWEAEALANGLYISQIDKKLWYHEILFPRNITLGIIYVFTHSLTFQFMLPRVYCASHLYSAPAVTPLSIMGTLEFHYLTWFKFLFNIVSVYLRIHFFFFPTGFYKLTGRFFFFFLLVN